MVFQVVKTLGFTEAAIFSPFCVARQTMVSASLYVQRHQVQAVGDLASHLLEQMLGQLKISGNIFVNGNSKLLEREQLAQSPCKSSFNADLDIRVQIPLRI